MDNFLNIISEQNIKRILQAMPDAFISSIRNSMKNIVKEMRATGKPLTQELLRSSKAYHQLYQDSFDQLIRQALRESGKPELTKLSRESLTNIMNSAKTNAELKSILDQSAVHLNEQINAELIGALRDEKGTLTRQTKGLMAAEKAGSIEAAETIVKNQKLQSEIQQMVSDIDTGKIARESLDNIEKMIKLSSEQAPEAAEQFLKGGIHNIFSKDGLVYKFARGRLGKVWKNRKVRVVVISKFVLAGLLKMSIPIALGAYIVHLAKKHRADIIPIKEDGSPFTDEELSQISQRAPCFQTLIDKKIGKVGKNSQGIRYVYVRNTEGQPWGSKEIDAEGGLTFYEDGRVTTGMGTQSGRWDCSALQELYQIGLSILNEENVDDVVGNIRIIWNKKQPAYRPQYVLNNNFPFQQGQKNDRVREMQVALGFEPKYRTGNFGPITMKALQNAGYDMSSGITPEIYNDVLQKYTARTQPQAQAQVQTQPQTQVQPQAQTQAQQPIQRVQPIANVSSPQIKLPSLSSLAPGQDQQRKS